MLSRPKKTGDIYFQGRNTKMVHTFKFGGQRIAYDSVSGLTLPLTELAYKMLDYLELPMAKECSTALRYDLAKFDSAAITETYNMFYALYKDGKIFAEGAENADEIYAGAAILVGDVLCARENPHVYDTAMKLVSEGKDVTVKIVSAPEGVAAFTDAELPAVLKELEKLAKMQAKLIKGTAEGTPFTAFAKLPAKEHKDEACAHCWASKLCTQSEPKRAVCELECKRAECAMLCETAAVK